LVPMVKKQRGQEDKQLLVADSGCVSKSAKKKPAEGWAAMHKSALRRTDTKAQNEEEWSISLRTKKGGIPAWDISYHTERPRKHLSIVRIKR